MALTAWAVCAGTVLLVGGGLATFSLSPLCRVVAHARGIANDPIGQYIYTGRRDEAGELAIALNMLEAEAGALVGRISDSAKRLTSNAGQLLSTVENSKHASETQKQETDLAATSTNQMVASVQEVANSARLTPPIKRTRRPIQDIRS